MYNVKLYNKISKVGLNDFDTEKYTCSEDFENYDAVLVRSAKLHDVQFPADLKCIARAGAGVNNIPIDRCSQEGIVVFNTPGANVTYGSNSIPRLRLHTSINACTSLDLGSVKHGAESWASVSSKPCAFKVFVMFSISTS